MEEENFDQEIDMLNSDPKHSSVIENNELAKIDPLNSMSKDDNISCESILSSINEECIKLTAQENENGIKSDSENSLDKDHNNELKSDSEASLDKDNDKEIEKDSCEKSLSDYEEIEKDICEKSPDSPTTNNNKSDSHAEIMATSSNSDSANDKLKADTAIVSTGIKDSINKDIDNEAEEMETDLDKTASHGEKSEIDLENKTASQSDGEKSEIDSENKDEDLSEQVSDDNKMEDNDKLEDNQDIDNEKNDTGKLKIKLRSFASLCDTNIQNETTNSFEPSSTASFEVSGVAVGDIVQHSNFVESDESGVMHLKISNVVGGEDCITGVCIDDSGDVLPPLQLSSLSSLIEPISPEGTLDKKNESAGKPQESKNDNDIEISVVESSSLKSHIGVSNNKERSKISKGSSTEIIINVFKSPLIVPNSCLECKKKMVCEFRWVCRENSECKVSFVCSSKCKSKAVSNLADNQVVQKPRLYFERVCGMCGKEISNAVQSKVLSWQTREFCDKLCLADHIGEVARTCFYCKNNVRVLYMVKYCVRFGSDVHQFCCNTCLESYKTTIKVCSFCQKNLNTISKVISPSNKEYCSNKCLKRAQRRDIGQINYKEENDCTVCLKNLVNQYEFIHNNAITFLCSNPCLSVFKYVNQVKSVNCCLCARLLNAEDTSNYFFDCKQLRVFCSESCFSVFVISARKIVTCHYCKVKKYNFDMIRSQGEDSTEYFCCSVCCLNLVESQKNKNSSNKEESSLLSSTPNSLTPPEPPTTQASNNVAVSASSNSTASITPILKNCNMCSKLEPAQFHMVMSDSTLRSFCSYMCATRFKCTFGFQVSGIQVSEEKEDEAVQRGATSTQTKICNETQTNVSSAVGSKIPSKLDLKDAKTLMRLFCPPHLSNKSTMCKPLQNTKGIQCKPHQWHKGSQTESESGPETKAIIPVPIPVYVPTPMMMYSSPTPVPLIIPVPVPIPIFIPTAEKTTKELENKIKSVLGITPEEEEAEEEEEEEIGEEEATMDVQSNEQVSTGKRKLSEDQDEHQERESNEETELEAISRLERSLSKYNVNAKDGVNEESTKRKADNVDYMSPKRRKYEDDDEADDENEEAEVLNLILGLSVWHAWVQRKTQEDLDTNQYLLEDLSLMSSDVLGESLIYFLNDISVHLSRFEADTIFYILLGLQKYLFEKGSTHCIFLEINFDKFTSVFDEMVEKFFSAAAQPSTKCLQGTRVTEEMLWEARQLGAHTPHVLINTLFYFNTKIFKLKTATDHFNLTFAQISKEGKRTSNAPDGSPVLTMYLKYCPESKSGSKGKQNASSLLMYENKENPLRCPVKLYEFYLSKCPFSIRTEKETYYVYPEQSCLPDSPVWYSAKSIEEGTIDKMLNRILLVKEVQEALFGH